MDLSREQVRLLMWVEEKRPTIGIFHNMSNIDALIETGLIENRPVPRCKGQLVITATGKAALTGPKTH